MLIKISLNARSKSIVPAARDAIESHLTSPLDALVIGSFLLEERPDPGP